MKKIFFGISMMLLSAMSFSAMAQTQTKEAQNGAAQCTTRGVCQKGAAACDSAANCDSKQKNCDQQKNCDRQKKRCDKKVGQGQRKSCLKGDSVTLTSHKIDRQSGKRLASRHQSVNRGAHKATMRGAKGDQKSQANLFNGIELSAEQQTKLANLNEKMQQDRTKAAKEMTAKKDKMKEEAAKLKNETREAYDKGVKEILTAGQYTKYEANRAAMQAKKDARVAKGKVSREARRAEKSVKQAAATVSSEVSK